MAWRIWPFGGSIPKDRKRLIAIAAQELPWQLSSNRAATIEIQHLLEGDETNKSYAALIKALANQNPPLIKGPTPPHNKIEAIDPLLEAEINRVKGWLGERTSHAALIATAASVLPWEVSKSRYAVLPIRPPDDFENKEQYETLITMLNAYRPPLNSFLNLQ